MYIRLSLTMTKAARMRRYAVPSLLCALVMAALAALPTASAQAATTLPEIVPVPPAATSEVLEAIPLEDLNASELAKVIGSRPGLEGLPETTLTAALEEVLAKLAGKGVTAEGLGEPGELVPEIEQALKKLLSPSELLALLKGESLTAILTNALGSLEPEELIKKALEASSHPEELLTQALSGVNPEELEKAVGSTLAGEPFAKTSVGELESSLGTTPEQFTQALGTSSEKLPETAKAFTVPLSNGQTLGVLDELQSIGLATLKGEGGGIGGNGGEAGNGGSGSGGSGGKGGNGGPGGSGSGVPGAGTTVAISTPGPAGGSPAGSSAAVGKVKVLSRRVHGNTATIVLQVPSAGSLTVSGGGVKKVTEQTAKSERVTVRIALTKAGIASRHRHHSGMSVKLNVTFKPVSGAASAASTSAHFG